MYKDNEDSRVFSVNDSHHWCDGNDEEVTTHIDTHINLLNVTAEIILSNG